MDGSTARIFTIDGADRHGFLTFGRLHEQALKLGFRGFLESFGAPALVPVPKGLDAKDLASMDNEEQDESRVQLLTMAVRSPGFLVYLGKVAFLAKRPGNPFSHLISIGRSPKNDITVSVESVSKVHGYFVADGGAWAFTDRGSTNGSAINDKPVEQGKRYRLEEGMEIRLGFEAVFEVVGPENLYRRAQQGY